MAAKSIGQTHTATKNGVVPQRGAPCAPVACGKARETTRQRHVGRSAGGRGRPQAGSTVVCRSSLYAREHCSARAMSHHNGTLLMIRSSLFALFEVGFLDGDARERKQLAGVSNVAYKHSHRLIHRTFLTQQQDPVRQVVRLRGRLRAASAAARGSSASVAAASASVSSRARKLALPSAEASLEPGVSSGPERRRRPPARRAGLRLALVGAGEVRRGAAEGHGGDALLTASVSICIGCAQRSVGGGAAG